MGDQAQNVQWLEQAYDEAMDLLYEAKNYNKYSFSKQVRHLNPRDRLDATTESMRVTSRLSHTVAWLLNEKAISNDELTRDVANNLYPPLTEEEACLNDHGHDREDFPWHLRDLLSRSLQVFNRAARLEGMLREGQKPPRQIAQGTVGLTVVETPARDMRDVSATS